MEVLKLEIEGVTASFRYPHFTWGRQPTFLMPPPSTIYGLISSVLGNFFEPSSIQFAYRFEYEGKAEDLEHIHAVQSAKGNFLYYGEKYPKNIEGNINPLVREFLFQPKLTLYIDRVDLYEKFIEPRYNLTLGRSQDLGFLNKIEKIDLKKSRYVYWEHSLLPWSFRPLTSMGISLMMPRYIDTEKYRKTYFQRYIILQQRLFSEKNEFNEKMSSDHVLMKINGNQAQYLYDPTAKQINNAFQGVIFHSFIEKDI